MCINNNNANTLQQACLDFFIFVLNLNNFKAVNIPTQNDRGLIYLQEMLNSKLSAIWERSFIHITQWEQEYDKLMSSK